MGGESEQRSEAVEAFEAGFEGGEVDLHREMRALAPGSPFLGIRPGDWLARADEYGRPPEDPVVPLGYDGDIYYFLTARGTVSYINDNRSVSKTKIKGLYAGCTQFLWWAYPSRTIQKRRDPNTNRVMRDETGNPIEEWVYKRNFDADLVIDTLLNACSDKGAWKEVDKVRGRGAWVDDEGRLILHLGNRVVFDAEHRKPGEHGDFIYPNRPKLPGPSEDPQPAPQGGRDGFCGQEMLDIIKSWGFVRPEIDPMLLLGWLCAAQIGGALDYRPTVFLTGDKAVGKSTIQELVGKFFGSGLVQSAETTAAGIYQHAGHDSLPVAIDELEAEADSRKVLAVVKLARLSATGGVMLRGGSDHNPIDFKAQSCFLFSAINMPPLKSQDRSRMAILEMQEIPEERRGEPPILDDVHMYAQELLRRTVDLWKSGHLPALIAYWRKLLIKHSGYDGRGASTFGTLMACAWGALSDEMPTEEEASFYAGLMKVDAMVEMAGNENNWELCVNTLLNRTPSQLNKCTYTSVGQLLSVVKDILDPDPGRKSDWTVDQVNNWLHKLGLSVKWQKRGGSKTWFNAELFIPASHPALNDLFDGSDWAGVAGAGGVWSGALRQMPADWWRETTQRVASRPQYGLCIRLKELWGKEVEDDGT